VKLLFVRSNKIGSRIIRWALRDDVSHFAVCFDEKERLETRGSGIVFHSEATGAKLEWMGEFIKSHQFVHALSFKTPVTGLDEESIYQGMLETYSGQGYDFKALAFWIWRGILWRGFGRPLPAKNLWAVNGYNLCTGVAGGVKWIRAWAKDRGIDLEMIGPGELHRRLEQTGYFAEEREWCTLQNLP